MDRLDPPAHTTRELEGSAPNAKPQYAYAPLGSRGYRLKLSVILAPLIAAKVPHEQIMSVILAFESETRDALEERRKADAERQARKRERDMSRDITLRHSDRVLAQASVTRVEDKSLTTEIEPQVKKVSKQRATRLPEGFEPDLGFATGLGFSPSQATSEAAKFRDYWIAKGGANAAKTDWPATWRNWARTAWERAPRAGPVNGKPQTLSQRFAELGNFAHDRENGNGIIPPQQALRLVSPGSPNK